MSNDTLSLFDALRQWCEPSLVQRVMDEECSHTEYEMDRAHRPQLTSRAVRRQPTRTSWMANGSDFNSHNAAWRDLEQDLRQRIERGQIHLRGVQLAPERQTEPEVVPRGWAADFKFDFEKGTIKTGKFSFAAIECSRVPWATATADPVAAPTPAQLSTAAAELRTLRPEGFAELDDETVLELLEEHARRVVENDTPLIAPGKVTLLPIIRRKMRWRAKQNELLSTMIAESEWLEAWMTERVGSYQFPKAPTIAKLLAKEYELIKPRSTPAT